MNMTTPTNEEVRRQFEAWSTAKPTKPGYYLVRGFQLDRDKQSAACVEVRAKRGSLICNLHECNSDLDKRDEESWYPLAYLGDTLQWVELVQSPAVVAMVEALKCYRAAVDGMNDAMRDGVNVQGALSELVGAQDNLDAALAACTPAKSEKR